MRLPFYVTFFILLSASLLSYAKPPVSQARESVVASRVAASSSSQQQDLREQNLLLKQQVKLLEDSHDSILATTHWALGGVFTMAFLLAGFSWLNNNKLYSADKQRLKEELEANISKAIADLQLSEQDQRGNLFLAVDKKLEVQNVRLDDSVSAIRTVIDDFRKQESGRRDELLRSVESRIESLIGRTSGEISEVRSRNEELRSRIDSLSEKLGALQDVLSSNSSRIDKELQQGAAIAREIEEHIWKLKKIPSNILITQLQGLSASLAADDEWGVKRVLARMKSTINDEFVSSGLKIQKRMKGLFEDSLAQAQKIVAVEASEVLQLILDNLEEDAEP
ncbi:MULTISPECIES: hypothetical protein [unclassified Pseudoxanthomonas]|uniref:hypothetical protein n=1 Tax=unclassified Pseudoxanthomonas TaxID=2645906 RepID=UPI0008E10A99|nr:MULTISPECIES: hypothetical protein [unclassified Pseudoxanthomonas]PPJ43980.1 hypothetical protein C0063_12705 [Pseudoxanthomonas sp. KAs_5_3]SFV25987.1 hypothetical protein SAMN05428990_0062 [Pseudoxanthomonas sp. YR558]